MEMRTLGKDGLKVTALGLGCMGMSDFYAGKNEDDAASIRTIHHALDRGINFLDTADMYGPFTNEVLVGKAVREWKGGRGNVVLATKFGAVRKVEDPKFRGVNGRPEYVRACCDASLQRLGLETIDLWYQHRVDPTVAIEETIGAMKEMILAGKVRHLGMSEAGVATLRRANAVHAITALQSEYSLWSRDMEDGILPACRELGIGFVAYSPLGRGFLTGQLKRPEDFPEDDVRKNQPRFLGENFAKNLALVGKIEAMAAKKGCTAAQLALAWVLAQAKDIVAIPGTKKIKYVDENLGALGVRLTEAELKEIDGVFPKGAFAGERYPEKMMAAVGR